MDAALAQEKALIIEFNPPFNVMGSQDSHGEKLSAAQQEMKERQYREQGVTPEMVAEFRIYAAELGKKGGLARARNRNAEERSESARKAVQAPLGEAEEREVTAILVSTPLRTLRGLVSVGQSFHRLIFVDPLCAWRCHPVICGVERCQP